MYFWHYDIMHKPVVTGCKGRFLLLAYVNCYSLKMETPESSNESKWDNSGLSVVLNEFLLKHSVCMMLLYIPLTSRAILSDRALPRGWSMSGGRDGKIQFGRQMCRNAFLLVH